VGSNRDRIADFWDDYFKRWLAGEDPEVDPLPRWKASYRGVGSGALQDEFSAEPYTGDLRGSQVTPRLVVLGLNPGVGYPELQGRDPLGVWMRRIAASSYSECLDRFPFGDPAWRAIHGGESSYWLRLMNFARRWTRDDALPAAAVLNMELYPWHSRRLVGSAIRPPLDVVRDFIWAPIAEVDVGEVFAFGADWHAVCTRLDLPELARYGPSDLPGGAPMKWNIVVFELAGQQRLVVNWQQGNSSPPGTTRLEVFRRAAALDL